MLLFGQQDKYQLNKACPAKLQRSGGFSLLETTIAIAILISAILGPMGLASSGIRSASVSRNNIVAANLAQEGVELIKNIRDTNKLSGKNWTQGLEPCGGSNGCRIDAQDLSVAACGPACAPLKLDSDLFLYNYASGDNTIFIRTIKTENVDPPDEIKVLVSISWEDRFGTQQFDLEASLFDW